MRINDIKTGLIMKTSILSISALIICMAFGSCCMGKTVKGNGNIVTREFQIGQFDEIELSLPATVNYSKGDHYGCIVKVDENILEYLDICTSESDLELKKAKRYRSVNLHATKFVIEVVSPTMKGIEIAGSGDVNVLSGMVGEKMSVEIAGSGDVNFKEPIEFREFDAEIAGSGDVKVMKHSDLQKFDVEIAGSGDVVLIDANVLYADIEIAGSGDVNLKGVVRKAKVETAGSGDVVLGEVVERIDYGIVGSGDIYYGGNPTVKGSKAGSGNIRQR